MKHIVALLALISITSVHAATFTDLGRGDGEGAQACAINDAGQIVVLYQQGTESGEFWDAKLYSAGVMRNLPLFSWGGEPFGINQAGQIAGMNRSDNAYHAAMFDPALNYIGQLPGLGGSVIAGDGRAVEGFATSINNSGQIVGYSYAANGEFHPFLWRNGAIEDLGCIGGAEPCHGLATAINDSGQVAGDDDSGHAFLYSNGQMTRLDPTGCLGSARGLAANGDVVGVLRHGAVFLAALFSSSNNSRFLPVYPFAIAMGANAINDNGAIVGGMQLGNGARGSETHGFIYRNGIVTDLNDFLSSSSGWQIVDAKAINDLNQIVGTALYQGQQRAFVLDLGSDRPVLLGAR